MERERVNSMLDFLCVLNSTLKFLFFLAYFTLSHVHDIPLFQPSGDLSRTATLQQIPFRNRSSVNEWENLIVKKIPLPFCQAIFK